jgi:hypothetical protein
LDLMKAYEQHSILWKDPWIWWMQYPSTELPTNIPTNKSDTTTVNKMPTTWLWAALQYVICQTLFSVHQTGYFLHVKNGTILTKLEMISMMIKEVWKKNRKGINVFIQVGLKILRWSINTEREVHSEPIPFYTYYSENNFIIIKDTLYFTPHTFTYTKSNSMENVKWYTKNVNKFAKNLPSYWSLTYHSHFLPSDSLCYILLKCINDKMHHHKKFDNWFSTSLPSSYLISLM